MKSKNQILKNSLIELAVKDQFIPGICNFCNRWCARCSKTHKCLSFAYSQEILGIDLEEENNDSTKINFWSLLEKQNIVYPSKSEKKEFTVSDLEEFAKIYAIEVKSWIDNNRTLFEENANQQLKSETQLEITFFEAKEVISWYSEFISNKINRSKKELNKRNNRDTSVRPNPYHDNIGSAKIAIIACQHTKAALSILFHNLANFRGEIKTFITKLTLIEEGIQDLFPKAIEFKRPGLDE